MDNVIFELVFLRKILLAPNTNYVFDLDMLDMDTDRYGVDVNLLREKRARYGVERWSKELFVADCRLDVYKVLFPMDQEIYRNITDEQISIMKTLMTFYLLQCESQEDIGSRLECVDLLVSLIVVLLESNKKLECEVWVKEHLSGLMSVKAYHDNTVLHVALDMHNLRLPREPLVRLLVEEAKMDVNIVNSKRETPLHLLSRNAYFMEKEQIHIMSTEDMMKLAEILINNGAHMDMVNLGMEASWYFSKKFPQFAFNTNLKCLAAKAILRHGIKYEKYAPKKRFPSLNHTNLDINKHSFLYLGGEKMQNE